MADRLVAVVTGASRGIGAATALELARRGYDVALTARSAEALEATAARCREQGTTALVLPGDLADMAFVGSIVPAVVARLGRVDVLVNNAAWRELVTLRTITLESWERTMRVCVTAPAFLARDAAADMEKRQRGVIINISSVQSRRVSGFAPAYMAAKGALDSLTYSLAALYGPRGLRVVSLNPGAIETEMSSDTQTPDGQNATQHIAQHSRDMIPLRRWGTPEEIARTIAWLAGDDASYITGTSVVADGGWSQMLLPYSFKRMLFPHEFT